MSNGGPSSGSSAGPLLPPRQPPKGPQQLPRQLPKGSSWDDTRHYIQTALKEWPTWFLRRLKVVAHYGFVPFVIAVGMSYEPRPSVLQLIGP